MKLNNLHDLYIEQLRDMYDAERQLVDKLPDMAKHSTNPRLKNCYETHLEETKNHVARLEQILDGLGESPKGETCDAMKGLLKEGKHLMKTDGNPNVIDAALIVAAQRVEHYEIAVYGSLAEFAKLLNRPADEQMLRQTLDEEKNADKLLMGIAVDVVNPSAIGPGEAKAA